MKFCSHCGSGAIEFITPLGDNRPRFVCPDCHTIHYQNPNIVAGTIPEWDGKILLCRRAIQPKQGLWTLPAGFMENQETTEQAALRETWEEARARVEIEQLYSMYSIPHISQVYMLFRAHLTAPEFSAGPESLEVRLFALDEIPWEKLAFRVVEQTLRDYVVDRRDGKFTQKIGAIKPFRNGS